MSVPASKRPRTGDNMDADLQRLYGSCSCERNLYTIVIPTDASDAQVFFDNSAANRRAQASPVTAWLRVPLDWFHSCTVAHFPDESNTSIRRTYTTPPAHPAQPPTRRQFCGYCGTHLTAWNEGASDGSNFMDVTLGSLFRESLDKLEELNLRAEEETDGDEDEDDDEDAMGDKQEEVDAAQLAYVTAASRRMQHRGVPFFEEMVEDSRLGRIKRQRGGRTSRDGQMTMQWEVVEIEGSDEPLVEAPPLDTSPDRKKRKAG